MSLPRLAANFVAGIAVVMVASACSDDRGANRPGCPVRNGSAQISVNTMVCPTITAFSVSPTAPTAGSVVELNATVVDPDSDNLTFVWTATSGQLDDPGVATSGFTCTEPGTARVTFTVSDGTCEDSTFGDVTCP